MSEHNKEQRWAVITLHPWLPSKTEQIARARAWGVDLLKTQEGEDVSLMIFDDVRKVGRTTNWMAHLTERQNFIDTMQIMQPDSGVVFFANPLCVGFSAKIAQQTVEGLLGAGLSIYVHAVKENGSAIYRPGDDMADFYEAVGLQANAAHQRAYNARSKSKNGANAWKQS